MNYKQTGTMLMLCHFVPNLTIGAPVVQCLKKHVKGFLDCHCMVSEPQKWVKDFGKAGANQMTFHYETVENHEELCQLIRDNGMKVGMAIKPKTQIDDKIKKLCLNNLLDLILVMTVEPGFGGQKFMEDMMPKVKQLRQLCPNLNIQVDGGITCDNIHIVAQAGANVIVSGSGVYGHKDPKLAIQFMREEVKKCI
ncbi:ribulose-phosphate 3-epimerase, putative [Ichthyophthirius multifiliis]|uniref:ribulose-phosphate 3-epimerase n=1 Tax=Ichthyophthirius multifiliis TaxID=5932 RepID=G0QYU5_ICHMU|nr:ribulose-phosphate 3-epimerase, putative [Ichthyophthirius multifiliis]EGR29620.1 ribulose-phosphate 3-epimerase, putative [Ichthyophthirius multifiliis]|eukprot:XP_004030856.1 ribulose-phosphate 3-epimerase, putative [Ichthyophthirius multifiliis]